MRDATKKNERITELEKKIEDAQKLEAELKESIESRIRRLQLPRRNERSGRKSPRTQKLSASWHRVRRRARSVPLLLRGRWRLSRLRSPTCKLQFAT